MSEKTEKSEKILSYKGKPFVRQGNTICYGNATDKYILVMNILTAEKSKELDVGTKVFVQIQSTRETDAQKINVLKFAEFSSLYEAFDTGEYWLNKALEDGKL